MKIVTGAFFAGETKNNDNDSLVEGASLVNTSDTRTLVTPSPIPPPPPPPPPRRSPSTTLAEGLSKTVLLRKYFTFGLKWQGVVRGSSLDDSS